MEASMDGREHAAKLRALALGALGVVYGDIGTSPLYTLRECLTEGGGFPLTPEVILGVLSLIFWSLIITVTVKYVVFIMRADNQGEGGILALTALALRGMRPGHRRTGMVMAIGVMGASLFYGDSLITPAISVLSAVEGLHVVAPALDSYVIPITLTILVGLFVLQRFGTEKVGKFSKRRAVHWCLATEGWRLSTPAMAASSPCLITTAAFGSPITAKFTTIWNCVRSYARSATALQRNQIPKSSWRHTRNGDGIRCVGCAACSHWGSTIAKLPSFFWPAIASA